MAKKVALVTGGMGGIGTGICRMLTEQGYQVAAGYFMAGDEAAAKWQQEQKAAGFDIATVFGDVSDYDSCTKIIAQVEQQLGPIDALINNAGITRDITLRKMTRQQWHEVIDTNLTSVFNVTHQVINGMCDRGYGRIVNISSINGQKGQFGQTNYSAAKAGIHGFTMALAQEVAKKGVMVNTVSPGYVNTHMLAHIPQDILNTIIATIPIGRLGAPEDVARAVAFLTHPENFFVTGINLPVNGGQYMC